MDTEKINKLARGMHIMTRAPIAECNKALTMFNGDASKAVAYVESHPIVHTKLNVLTGGSHDAR